MCYRAKFPAVEREEVNGTATCGDGEVFGLTRSETQIKDSKR